MNRYYHHSIPYPPPSDSPTPETTATSRWITTFPFDRSRFFGQIPDASELTGNFCCLFRLSAALLLFLFVTSTVHCCCVLITSSPVVTRVFDVLPGSRHGPVPQACVPYRGTRKQHRSPWQSNSRRELLKHGMTMYASGVAGSLCSLREPSS